jgi:hypothetical protein
MIGFSKQEMAESYFAAADALVGRVRKRKQDGRDLVNPALFLSRQGIELYFKAIVQPTKRTHDLVALLGAFRRHIRERYKESVPEWLADTVLELARYDPHSDLFRYAGSRSRRLEQEGEFWVDLVRVRRHMRFVKWAFERTLAAESFGLRDLNAMVPPPRGRPISRPAPSQTDRPRGA